jgi:hypothetical protein
MTSKKWKGSWKRGKEMVTNTIRKSLTRRNHILTSLIYDVSNLSRHNISLPSKFSEIFFVITVDTVAGRSLFHAVL